MADSVTGQLSRIVIDSLARGNSVEIDGLGVFHPDPVSGFRFEARTRQQIFIAYVREDLEAAQRLYEELAEAGFAPWLDIKKLLPGQNWPRAIESAIETSDFFVACFSSRSVSKKGDFQAEIRYALDCARRMPLDEIFVVPVRLDGCPLPATIRRQYEYVDLFPDWSRGMRRLEAALESEVARRRTR